MSYIIDLGLFQTTMPSARGPIFIEDKKTFRLIKVGPFIRLFVCDKILDRMRQLPSDEKSE